MSNSLLTNYIKLSPNYSKRKYKITKITIHHMAGNLSVESCGNVFATSSRQASSNYGVGTDGRVGLYVDEKNRAWTSSNADNDHRAVTIEVANDGGAPNWHVSDKALQATIDLCVDICKRNGIERLNYTGDKSGNLTMHKYYANTNCPGPYLESKFLYIATEVNKRLGVKDPEKMGSPEAEGYLVKVTAYRLNVRKGPSMAYKVVTTVKENEIYTIVGESNGWGKLKSGAGWIKLSYTKRV